MNKIVWNLIVLLGELCDARQKAILTEICHGIALKFFRQASSIGITRILWDWLSNILHITHLKYKYE